MALALNDSVHTVCFDKVGQANVYIRPHEIYTVDKNNTIDHILRRKVAASVTQTCSKEGYVLSGTSSQRGVSRANRLLCKPLEIISRSSGTIPHEHLNGAMVYKVCYKHLVCNPPLNVVIPVVVCDSNRMGIRCQYFPYTFNEDTQTVDAGDVIKGNANFLTIFLPKELHFNLAMDADYSLETLYQDTCERLEKQVDDSQQRVIVYVRICQKRFDLNDKSIASVGVLHPKTVNSTL